MATMAVIENPNGDPTAALRVFFRKLLDEGLVDALLLPCEIGDGAVMPMLISESGRLDAAAPLAPAFPLNAASLVATLTDGAPGGRVAALLRPCEIRAFVELCKLNQGVRESVLVIGLDCLGAFDNDGFRRIAGSDVAAATRTYVQERLADLSSREDGDAAIAPACRVCEHVTPDGADVVLTLFGSTPADNLTAMARTAQGQALLDGLKLPEAAEPEKRAAVVAGLVSRRTVARDAMFERTGRVTGSIADLATYLSHCVNCQNCRNACPVCYCRECVFKTDVFEYKPWRYLRWAKQRGAMRMPADTVFFHLTRLAHMSTACIGCGQCSNACPNDIPVMELFRTVAARTQAAFEYEPGRDINEAPPLSVFAEREFAEMTGEGD